MNPMEFLRMKFDTYAPEEDDIVGDVREAIHKAKAPCSCVLRKFTTLDPRGETQIFATPDAFYRAWQIDLKTLSEFQLTVLDSNRHVIYALQKKPKPTGA